MPYLGKTPSQATRQRYYKTASGGETSISGTMTTGGTLTFNDGEFVDVSVNGVALVAGTDYNTNTANTIAGLSALSANDQVEIVVYDTFSVFGGNVDADFNINNGNLSVSGTSTLTGAVTASGGATLSSSSSGEFNALTISQADNTSGNESRIRFKRTTDAGSDREVAAIVADRVGGNDTALVFETNTDGSDGATERARISHDGKFGVGTNSPQSVTHFKGTASGENILHLDNSAGSGHGDTNNNVRVVSGNNGYWANLVIAAHSLEFKVQGGSTGITAESDGDLSIADGNLVLASGHGISFAATSDVGGMSSELLDDYEEGTWTPSFGTNSGSVATASSVSGHYTKVGRMVTVVASITDISTTGTTSGSQLRVASLPYTVDVQDTQGSVVYDNAALQSSRTQMVAEANTSNFILFRQAGNDISDTPMDHGDITSGSTDLMFTITYFSDQ